MCALGLGMMVVILGFAGLDQNGNLDGVDSWQNVKGSVVKWGEGYGLGLGSEGQAEKLGEEEGEKAFVDCELTCCVLKCPRTDCLPVTRSNSDIDDNPITSIPRDQHLIRCDGRNVFFFAFRPNTDICV